MYFRFIDDVTFGRNRPYGNAWSDTGAKSDIYECLVFVCSLNVYTT